MLKIPNIENNVAQSLSNKVAKKILDKIMKQDGFPLMEEEIAKIVREELNLPKLIAQANALAFAASVIKSGEPWTSTCEDIIGKALA